ncbi:phage portal protein [Sphingopyxis indica]|uniref:phage portal protein n=1 Tax=Sphingopyxis indica TaxID=436663 RepID=UPI0029392046|nr:phage portal protein [Sphingopyxis indica]
MGLRASLARMIGGTPEAGAPSASSELVDTNSDTFWALSGRSGSRVVINEQTSLGLPAVLRALEVLTGVFAMTPMIYYRREGEGKQRVETSPLFTIFHDRPNDVQSAFLFKEVMLGDMLMAGQFATYVHRDGMYRPKSLSRLNPRSVLPAQFWDRNDGLELFYDAQLPDGSSGRFTRTDIWHVPGFSRDGIFGVNRVRLLDDMLGAAVAAGEYARHFWENNAQPATLLTAKGKIKPEDKTKFKIDWKRMFGGPRKAGDVAVLDQEMDAKTLGATNKDSQFVEVRAFNVVEVARAFGVPPHLLFELTRATFSNIEQQSLEFITYCMMPHYERVASAATHYFAEEGHFFEFLPDALLKGDVKTRWEAYKAAREAGVLNADEIRNRENMNAIGGAAGNERWRPANMAVSGEPNQPGADTSDPEQP